jgi:hypothetical protein
MNGLCEHNQNPRTCLTCFRKPKVNQQQAQAPQQGPDVPRNALGAPVVRGYGAKPPLRTGDRTGSNVGQPGKSQPEVSEAEREAYRYPQGRPAFQPGALVTQPVAHTTESPGTYDRDGLWQPAEKPQLMDQLPSHPKAPPPR